MNHNWTFSLSITDISTELKNISQNLDPGQEQSRNISETISETGNICSCKDRCKTQFQHTEVADDVH